MGAGRGRRVGPRLATGFTVVEILAVVGVVAILMLLLVPSIQRSMRQASSTVCMHQLKEINRALQEYRLENCGWLPDVSDPATDGPVEARAAAWYGGLIPKYLGGLPSLACPADPLRSQITSKATLEEHPDPDHASSYGMNGLIRAAGLGHVDRFGPANPLETILVADLGPDVMIGDRVSRNGGWLAWDDGFHPGTAGLRDSWLTGRHFGHINVLTMGGAVQRVRTAEMLEERISNYYGDCSAGGCPLCAEYEVAHYSFAPERLFWWTGAIRRIE